MPQLSKGINETLSLLEHQFKTARVRVERELEADYPVTFGNAGKLQQGQRRQTQIGNAVYTVIPLYLPMTAIKAGSYNLGPLTASVVLVSDEADLEAAFRQRAPYLFVAHAASGPREERRWDQGLRSFMLGEKGVPRN